MWMTLSVFEARLDCREASKSLWHSELSRLAGICTSNPMQPHDPIGGKTYSLMTNEAVSAVERSAIRGMLI